MFKPTNINMKVPTRINKENKITLLSFFEVSSLIISTPGSLSPSFLTGGFVSIL